MSQQQEEFLDVVDKNNNPTGEVVSRKRVHSEGLWHRVVHMYVFRRSKDRDGIEFLVHLRSPHKDHSPNKWDTRFGGHVQSGKTLHESVETELMEEIGVDARIYDLIEGDWMSWDDFPNREFQKVYYLEVQEEVSNMVFNDGEVQEVRWMSTEEIRRSIKVDTTKWTTSLEWFVIVSEYLHSKI